MKGKVRIHASFFFLMILIIALGQVRQLLLILIAVTAHEISHLVYAWLCGLKTRGIIITPVGEIGLIEDFDHAGAAVKYGVLLAGPLTNLFLAALMFLLGIRGTFLNINLTIGLFNLLPFYPLDGGRLFFVFLGNRMGILNSVKYVRRLTKAGIVLLCVLGFLQTILHPFNISLICVAAFFITIFRKESGGMVFSYYRCMLGKHKWLGAGMNVRTLALSDRRQLPLVHKRFSWDYYHIVHVVENGGIVCTLTETELFGYALAHSEL